MVAFQRAVEYIKGHYPQPDQLTEDRLFAVLYLIDWKSAIERKQPLTDLLWQIERVPEPTSDQKKVVISAIQQPGYELQVDASTGHSRVIGQTIDNLSTEDTQVIDFVIQSASQKSWPDLLRLVYSTFPVMTQPKHAPLDLVALADKYNREYRPWL